MKITEKLNKKMRACIELEILHPAGTKQELANELGVHLNTVGNWFMSPVYVEERDRRLKEVGHESAKQAQEKMISLMNSKVDSVACKAAQYILDSTTTYKPTDKIEADVSSKVIEVEVVDD